MEAKSRDRKTVQLFKNGEQVGELLYQNIFLSAAQIKLPDSGEYELKPAGIFSTSISVTKNGTEIASLKMNWKAQIVFTFLDGQDYVFKARGVFYNKYVIENKDGEPLLLFDPKFNWSKFDYNYDISYEQEPKDHLLVLLGVYAANYFIAAMSGTM